jgi:hypothetical protein
LVRSQDALPNSGTLTRYHQKDIMFLLNNQLNIDLQSHVDFDSLKKLEPYFVQAIVKSWKHSKPTIFVRDHCIDSSTVPLYEVVNHYKNHPELFPNHEFYNELIANDWLSSYLRFVEPVQYGGMSINLQYIKNIETWFSNRGDPDNCKRTDAYDNFPFLFEWLQENNIFSKIGRCVVYVAEANMKGIVHYDIPKDNNLHDFIWINLDKRKRLFVQDSVTKEKFYIDSPIAIFDDRNYHGVENSGYAAWSIRVDGFFSDDFKSKINWK